MRWGHPRNLNIYAPPNLDMIFFTSPCFPATRRERHVFAWNDVKSWTPSKILSREDRGIRFDFSTFLLPSHLFDFSAFRFFCFSSSLSTLNSSKFVLLAANVRKGTRQKLKKSTVKKCPFRLFDFSAFRLFGFSSSLSALNALNFVLLAAHVQLEKHPAKIQPVRK